MQELIESSALYLVATPIGNLNEISPRAKYILSKVDVVLCEDTRRSGWLLKELGIFAKLVSFHLHNSKSRLDYVIDGLKSGKSIALISDAGMPLICDPGSDLVHKVYTCGYRVIPVSGPCALINAVAASGLCEDGFTFVGFLPTKQKAKYELILKMRDSARSWVLFEAPHRMQVLSHDLQKFYPAEHKVLVAREITKLHEEIKLGCLDKLMNYGDNAAKGEFVVVVNKLFTEPGLDENLVNIISQMQQNGCSNKSIALWISSLTGIAKNKIMNYLIGGNN